MALVFVRKESEPGETRVAATPETVKGYVKHGLEVVVEPEAGLASGFPDEEYAQVGASLRDALGDADLVLSVRTPPNEAIAHMKQGACLISSLVPAFQLDTVKALAEAGVSSFAMEAVPRITRAQKMDVLSSQATCAGYEAVLMAAASLPRMFPLMMTAAGTIRPAKVFVLGAGVAGLQAIATAKRLGAQVEANDVRPAVKEQVESLGAKFVDTGTPPDAETAGGYAKEASEDYLKKQREILTKHIGESDVVITTALVPGRKAPRIVNAEMLKGMRPGSVIVDLAVGTGGNVEGSKPGETVFVNGIKILGETNLPSLLGGDASRMWARNVASFLDLFVKEGQVQPAWDDEIVKATCITHAGEVRDESARQAMGGAS